MCSRMRSVSAQTHCFARGTRVLFEQERERRSLTVSLFFFPLLVSSPCVGAVLDNPSLIALAIVGDGEAETGPLEGSWKGISFLNPKYDGAVLPILHLNGYKVRKQQKKQWKHGQEGGREGSSSPLLLFCVDRRPDGTGPQF